MSLADIDIYDQNQFVEGVPHAAYARLRAEAPVFRHERPGQPAFWAITKYADVMAISKNPGTFSSFHGTNIFEHTDEQLTTVRTLMLNMDPPQHTKFRRLVSQGFTPRITARLEPHIREVATTIIDRVAARGECDFVPEISAELPLQVIVELMGIPIDERHLIFDWSNRLIGFDDPEFQTSFEDGTVAATQMWMYANDLANKRRERPLDDLVSVLMQAEVDGEHLTEMEFDSFFLLLAVAGNETTRNLISGGMLALIEHPEQRAQLVANPSMIPTAIEEMLRWVSPVMHFRRTATRDTAIRDQRIREGEKVVMFYPAANRDEEVFPHADRFNVRRMPNEHLAFGIGEHFCLGANLARLEIRVMFEELLRRLPDIELAGPVRRLRSNFINGVKSIPVKFTPERSAARAHG